MTTSRRFRLSAALAAVLVATATADVLVTKMGKKYEGQVVEQGEGYAVTTTDGKKLVFPKDAVREVVTQDTMKKEYDARRKAADALPSDAEKLKALQELAAWCESQQFPEQARDAWRGVCVLRRKSLQAAPSGAGKAEGLADLAAWCEEHELADDAKEAEAEALKLAPDSPAVREKLGYVKHSVTGHWAKSAWEVNVTYAAVTDEHRESGFFGTTFTPPHGQKVAEIIVQFEAKTPAAVEAAHAWRALVQGLTPEARKGVSKEILPDFAGAPRTPSRLFISSDCLLLLQADNVPRKPAWTSRPEGSGVTFSGSSVSTTRTPDKDPSVLKYARLPGATAAFVVPKHTARLTLLFVVPPGTQRATLQFADYPPIPVQF